MTMPYVDLYGKLAIVTGANSGIGYEIARALASMGARVVMACRNAQKGEAARRSIVKQTGSDAIKLEILDCGSFSSVRELLGRWEKRDVKKVDVLINNAGCVSGTMAKTPDGFEVSYQTNRLSHILLTHTLFNRGHFSPTARIVSNSSCMFYTITPLDERTTDASDILEFFPLGSQLSFNVMVQMYNRTKAAQAVWSTVLQRRLSQSAEWKEIVVQSCHPGIVKSPIMTQPAGTGSSRELIANLVRLSVHTFGISNEQGAVVPFWLATAEEPARPEMRGLYWDRLAWKWVPAWSLEESRQEMLWDKWTADSGAKLVR